MNGTMESPRGRAGRYGWNRAAARARVALAGASCAVAIVAACASAPDTELVVAVASGLAAVVPELTAGFEVAHGIRVTTTLGASGQLAQQVLQGAPVDVVLFADDLWLDRLEAAGRIDPATRAVCGYGALVLLAGRQAEPPATVAALAGPAYTRIAIANPEGAPFGRAAVEALERAGVYGAVSDRLVLAENVRQTVQFAESRAVDVSLTSLALIDTTRHRWVVVPADLHAPLAQTAAVVAGRPAEGAAAAAAFIAFLLGAEGRAILARHRFVLP